MLDKLHKFQVNPRVDRARIDVIRHRVRSRLTPRGRLLLAVASALAVVGLASLGANATTGSGSVPPGVTAGGEALANRQSAAERADRGERSDPDQPGKQTEDRAKDAGKSGGGSGEGSGEEAGGDPDAQGAAPEQSPEPEPEPEPSESKKDKPRSEANREEKPQQEEKPDWVHPMPGAGTTSCYGSRWGVLHAGVDLAAAAGTKIRAVGAGTVAYAGWVFAGYGISVVIDHHNGVFTHYAHASQANVSPGEKVSPGETIAREGSTGDSTGPHLHFEVHKGMWNQVEPTNWMANHGVNIGGC